MTKEKIFWNWFVENNSKYYYLNQMDDVRKRENLLNTFLSRLHLYSEHLFFELGGHPGQVQELVISAGGDKNYFQEAEELVKFAPEIQDWKILALKPTKDIHFVTNYEGIEIDPKQIWFLPLNSDTSSVLLGLRLCFNFFHEEDGQKLLRASWQILETLLGERSCALEIHHVEVGGLPPNPEDNGLIELEELPAYVKWHYALKH